VPVNADQKNKVII